MDAIDKKIRELTEAMHAENDARIRNRIMAVRGVLKGHTTKTASDFADVDQRTVQLWAARFDEDGMAGLRDASGRGRPRCVGYGRIKKLADRLSGKNMLTPRKLRNWIRGKLFAKYSLCSVRRIMRSLGFSSKRSTTEYTSAAGGYEVRRWQVDAAGTISSAKQRGFTIVVQDESIFIRIGTNGRKLWSRVGDPVAVSRTDRRDKTIVYGALAEEETRLMRAVRQVRRLDVCEIPQGGAPQVGQCLAHSGQRKSAQARKVREYLEEHDEVEILYLPTATPKLNAVESVWRDAKYRLVTSEYYETLEDLTHAVSEYFRTCSIKLDIYRFLYRCI